MSAPVDLFVDCHGAPGGCPLVVLHGFTGSGAAMSPVVAKWATGRHVITVDLTGHGRSPAPADVECYAMDQVVSDLWRAIGEAEVDIFGYSMGGRVALHAAVAQPDRVRRLALLGASAGLADPTERTERRTSDHALAASIASDGLPAFVDRWLELPLFASLHELGPEWLEQSKAQRCESDPVGLANSLRGTGTGAMDPLHGQIQRVDVPTLWLAGALDQKYSELGAMLSATMPAGSFQTVADAGHAAHSESPALVAGLVSDFLDVP